MKVRKTSKRELRHRRIRKQVHGTKERPRLVVYRSNDHIYTQLVDDDEGKTLVSVSDLKMKESGDVGSAKKVGEQLAKDALAKKITTCIFDRSGYKYHGKVKAIADAAREGGLKF